LKKANSLKVYGLQGFVVQETTSQTVEDFLFDALIKTRLIEQRTTSNYHRCGRTDRG
jgi:tRNA pseudouridine38/39 synthase